MTRYCGRCGASGLAPAPSACPDCGYEVFVNPRPTGSVIVMDGDRYLALRRVREPNAGRWDLPGGFCDGLEHPRETAVREAREELGLDVRLGAFVGMYVGMYRYQDEDLPVLDCFWLAGLAPDAVLRLDPAEASAHAWLPLHDPPTMAFSTMDIALRDVRALLPSLSRSVAICGE